MARMAALPAALSGAPDDRCACVGGPAKTVASSVVSVWPFGRLCAAAATRLPVPHAQLWRQPHSIAAARCASVG
eukprot:scaffold4968_cov129-Isochrysis_galbana.AAC.4